MNQPYFAPYRQGFQTMPDNAYEMMTAPSRQSAGAIKDTASRVSSALIDQYTQKQGAEALQQGAAAQYSGLESLSKATGVPMNPELSEQFKNMKSMNPQQQSVFNQSLGQEAQRQMTFFGINQAKTREARAQGQLYKQNYQSSLVSAGYTPKLPPVQKEQGGQGVLDPSLLPSYPSLLVPGYDGRTGPLRPMNQ